MMNRYLASLIFVTILITSSLKAHDDTFGISINPVRIGISDSEYETYSGTFSYFNHENNTEIAIPWIYERDTYLWDDITSYKTPDTLLNIDLQYKQYIDKERSAEGMFYGAFARYSYLHGDSNRKFIIAEQHKFGLGVLAGFQITTFSIAGIDLYWGSTLSVGFYLNKDANIFDSDVSLYWEDHRYILDLELLKIGITF